MITKHSYCFLIIIFCSFLYNLTPSTGCRTGISVCQPIANLTNARNRKDIINQDPRGSDTVFGEATTSRKFTVLSIDGGGIRGLIPAVVLEYLEKQLKELDGEDARLADYFDVIAGTSTGGLLAGLLTVPKKEDPNRPAYMADELVPFYLTHGPQIFKKKPTWTILGWLSSKIKGPKYDGEYLHQIINKKIGDVKLSETVTSVVIPSFDISVFQPVIFSTEKAKRFPLRDPRFADVCISTSAAPTLFPPYSFDVVDRYGGRRNYQMVDGGVAASNPTMVAVETLSSEAKHAQRQQDAENLDYDKFLVISLGTGQQKASSKYNVSTAATWGALNWIYDIHSSSTPLLDMVADASGDMVDFHMSANFHRANCPENYLRIQYDDLQGDESAADNADNHNMNRLVQIGKDVLQMPVSRANLETGSYEPVTPGNVTNAQQLTQLAKLLSDERMRRHNSMPQLHN